jgi:hypothetical protein
MTCRNMTSHRTTSDSMRGDVTGSGVHSRLVGAMCNCMSRLRVMQMRSRSLGAMRRMRHIQSKQRRRMEGRRGNSQSKKSGADWQRSHRESVLHRSISRPAGFPYMNPGAAWCLIACLVLSLRTFRRANRFFPYEYYSYWMTLGRYWFHKPQSFRKVAADS